MKNLYQVILAIIFPLFIVACAAPNSSNEVYSASSLKKTSRTITGVVVSKREVSVRGTTGLGSSAGGAAGAALGIGNANSNEDVAGAVAGAVVGSLIGAAVEESATRQKATEYIVKSRVGGLMTIIQNSDEVINVGDKVFIVLDNKPRIIKDISGL